MIEKKRTFIELFAGCGGMSLGFNSTGYKLLFANELSPMPGATYAYNLIHKKKPLSNDPESWYHRLYEPDPQNGFSSNPLDHVNQESSEYVNAQLELFNGDMFIGSITQLNGVLEKITEKLDEIDIDVLSGGPPCQSFSLAGRRDRNNPRNNLPFEFAKCAQLINPKIVILENVSGILRPFIDIDGKKWHAWHEVAIAFFNANYIPICTHAEAQKYGVPQRRSRFLMLGIRKDIALKALEVLKSLPASEYLEWTSTVSAIHNSMEHFSKPEVIKTHKLYEFKWLEPNGEWPAKLLPLNPKSIYIQNVIDNLSDSKSKKDLEYMRILSESFDHILPVRKNRKLSEDEDSNRAHRMHTYKVKARFRLLRLVASLKCKPVNNQYLQEMSSDELLWLKEQELIFPNDNTDIPRKPKGIKELKSLILSLKSKKHSQRAMLENKIAPAQLSIPDDLVHYSEDRTLSVREMARIQSFPDWFEFKGKVTTGGKQRAYEVPRYTQVGNAVPPLMAKQISKGIRDFLDIIGE